MKPFMEAGLSWEEYRAIPALNWSLLKEMLFSPGELAWRADHPWEPSTQAIKGSAIDALCIEPETFTDRFLTVPLSINELPRAIFVEAPEGYRGQSKADKEWKAQQEAQGKIIVTRSAFKSYGLDLSTNTGKAWKKRYHTEGREILSAADMAQANGAAKAVNSYPPAVELIDGSQHQVTVVWLHEETNIWLKGRIDIRKPHETDPVVVDLKSTERKILVTEDGNTQMGKHAFLSGWHRQLAFYCDGCASVTGVPHDVARIIVVEQKPPHRVEVYELKQSVLEQGRSEYLDALRAYAHCLKTNNWPTSSGELQRLEFPSWATK